jgi:hypothetical protein
VPKPTKPVSTKQLAACYHPNGEPFLVPPPKAAQGGRMSPPYPRPCPFCYIDLDSESAFIMSTTYGKEGLW